MWIQSNLNIETNIHAPVLLNLLNLLRKCNKNAQQDFNFISFSQLV